MAQAPAAAPERRVPIFATASCYGFFKTYLVASLFFDVLSETIPPCTRTFPSCSRDVRAAASGPSHRITTASSSSSDQLLPVPGPRCPPLRRGQNTSTL